MRLPIDQKIAVLLRILPDANSRNLKKVAVSTGILPTTSKPKQANMEQTLSPYQLLAGHRQLGWRWIYATQLLPPSAARPNAPQSNSVMLNTRQHPMMSEAKSQKVAPTIRPTKREQVVNQT